jgi:hypothetical protein
MMRESVPLEPMMRMTPDGRVKYITINARTKTIGDSFAMAETRLERAVSRSS